MWDTSASCLQDLTQSYSAGPRSSAVVGGYTTDHRDLESALALLKETEEALLFPSGFAANQVRLPELYLLALLLATMVHISAW